MRAWLPVKTYPVSAGVKGGLAGGVAMAVLACAYGVLKAGKHLVSRSIFLPQSCTPNR